MTDTVTRTNGSSSLAGSGGAMTSQRATGTRVGPYVNYLFQVELSGITVADFSEVTGLDVTIQDEKLNEGGRNDMVRHLPGRVSYSNLTLHRGYVQSSELFKWCKSMLQPGQMARKDVTLSLMQVTHTPNGSGTTRDLAPVFTWTLRRAFPVKWSGPTFKADSQGNQAIAMERLEIAFESME